MIGLTVPVALFLAGFLLIAVLLLEYTDTPEASHHHGGRR